MKRTSLLLILMLAAGVQAFAYSYRTVAGDPMKSREYTLQNGLKVYMTQNAEKPEIQTMIVLRAGSQNDPLNSTGLAHYQEHLMFKGTQQYGTTDYAREKPILDQIDDLYELYGATTDAERRKAIYHKIDSLSYEGSKIAIANEFDKLMSVIGATGVNAYTSTDRTCYHEVIPSGELRRWAMIESDRFQNLVVRGFHTELETVYEEFNMYSTMDQDKVMLAVDQILYPDVPYRQHTVIGTQEHLKNPSLKNIKQFYQTYYRPNNVAILLAGDLDFDKTIAIIDQYFGKWQPNNNLPEFQMPVQKQLAQRKDTVVYGKESPELWMGWRFPAITDADIDAIEVMASVLKNGKCGLMDVDIDQKQLLLGAAAEPLESNDFTTFFLIGVPKEKQSLEEVRGILLAEIDKLKKGDFSEEMLKAIIANQRRYEMQRMESNRARANMFLTSFVYGIPYEDLVHELDRKAKITKDDIVRVANKYFTDSYACVFKQQGPDANPAKVEKPAITPIEMNREAQSAFFANLSAMHADQLKPQYLDFNKDLSRTKLAKEQTLYYVQNKENELFELDFVVERGTNTDPSLDLGTDLLDYLGTDKMSVNEFQAAVYNLAAEVSVYASGDETHFAIYGLQENFDATLRLMEERLFTAHADENIYKELVADCIKDHNDAKLDQRSNFSQLSGLGFYGKDVWKKLTMTPRRMKKLSGKTVLERVRALVPGVSRVTYYGPATQQFVTEHLNANSRIIALGDKEQMTPAPKLKRQQVSKSEVWMAPYKANNLYYIGYANWGEAYTPKDEAVIRLFNEYFNGSMGSIVFQEMRESRALCYASSANYRIAGRADDSNWFMTYIITQNDKLKECMQTFDSICDYLPISQTAFDQAKTSLLKSIEKRRYVRSAPIAAYLGFVEKGWDHDMYEDIYREVQRLTLDDVVAFQKEHVAKRTYRYMILGNKKELDMKYLKTRGKIRKFSQKQIFVY